MPSASKIKGSSFEREIAKYLSDRYNESFIRVPNSGAYVGGSNKGRKEVLHEGQVRSFKGDIIPGVSFPLLNIECKNYGDFPFHQLLTNCKVLNGWLQQLLDVSDEHDLNVLFMKFNHKGRYIAVQDTVKWDVPSYMVYKSPDYGVWIISELDTFFTLNSGIFKKHSQVSN
jgi:hypothetical protein